MLNLDLKKKYLLACSFGPDSMALFDMLTKGKIDFSVALVNYNLRDESTAEMASLISYCEKQNIPFHVKSVNAKLLRGNVEENCRNIRYSWFKELSNNYGFDAVLVAHHLDDLIETYLLQKNRKNQVKYFGIKEKTTIFDVQIVRPLLSFEKKELEAYCLENQVPFMIDKSNLSDTYKRNKIRHEIVEKMSKEDKLILLKEIESKNMEIEKVYKEISTKNLTKIDDLVSLSKTALQFVLNDAVKAIDPSISVSKRFTIEIFKMLESKKSVITMPIKNNVVAVKDYDGFHFEKVISSPYSYKLLEPDKLDTPYFFLDFSNEYENRNVSIEDFPLTVRNVEENDIIPINDYKRKAKKLFVDWKMPISIRKTWPVILNKDGIVIYMPRYQKDFKIKSNLNFWVK